MTNLHPGRESSEILCMNMVRDQDRARYLTTLYAPEKCRAQLWAVHAFNIELARVRDSVSEPMIGDIRLTWWREALEGIYAGAPRKHPVVDAMTSLVGCVPRTVLEEMINGRMTDIYDGQLTDIADLITYARQTGGAQQVAVGHILGLDAPRREAARKLGTAWTLVGVLRAVEFHARMQRVYLPAQELRAAGLDPESLFQRPIGTEIIPIVRRIAEEAKRLLEVSSVAVSRQALPAFLLRVLCNDHLAQLAKAGYDVTVADFAAGDVRRQLKLIKAVLSGRC